MVSIPFIVTIILRSSFQVKEMRLGKWQNSVLKQVLPDSKANRTWSETSPVVPELN